MSIYIVQYNILNDNMNRRKYNIINMAGNEVIIFFKQQVQFKFRLKNCLKHDNFYRLKNKTMMLKLRNSLYLLFSLNGKYYHLLNLFNILSLSFEKKF